jgi:uncharacterized membrane protein
MTLQSLLALLDRAPESVRLAVCVANVVLFALVLALLAGCGGRGGDPWLP